MYDQIIVVGAGNMGSAIVRGLLARHHRYSVGVVDGNQAAVDRMVEAGAIAVDLAEGLNEARAIVLAVPPHEFECLAVSSPTITRFTGLTISVMAGVTYDRMHGLFDSDQIVRAIPNTASEILEGMTAFYRGPAVTSSNGALSKQILDSFGLSVEVAEEAMIDSLTALCGGGPAFVARFAEVLAQFGRASGLTDPEAIRVSLQLLRGTADLIESTSRRPMQVCQEVMTPNGTTEQAMRSLDEGCFDELLTAALDAASKRSREIGQEIPT